MSISDNPARELPILGGYALRWVGMTLIVRPLRWHEPFVDYAEEGQDRDAVISVIRDLCPRFLIVDLHGVEVLPAIRTSLLVLLAKDLDGMKTRGRMFVVGVMPSVVDYLMRTQLDKLLSLRSTVEDALNAISIYDTRQDVTLAVDDDSPSP